METLGEKIRRLRQARGWTLDHLSTLSGVDLKAISALEKRSSVRSQFTVQLANAFGVAVEELLPGDATSHKVAEPSPPRYLPAASPWPFKGVTPDQWASLGAHQRDKVEAYIGGMLASAPAPKVANRAA